MTPYYQPSGRFTLGGILGLVLVGAVTAGLLALVYVYAVWYIPFIYLNFIFTLGLGFLLGTVLKTMVKVGKLRSPALAGWLGLALGVWAWYVQWCVYLTLLAGAGETESLGSRASFVHTTFEAEVLLGLVLSPGAVLEMLPRLAEEGTWSVFGVTISGIFLYVVWLAEFLIILLLSWSLPHGQAGEPFSELSNEWAQKTTLPRSASPFADTVATKAALEAADWYHLETLPTDAPAAAFGRLHLYQAPSDPDCCFLSLENVVVETDKNGKPSENATDVLEYLRVPPAVCRELHARFGAVAVSA